VRETALAVGLPRIGLELLRRTLPPASFEEIVLGADLYSPEEAVRLGIFHELVPPERLVDAALAQAAKYREVPWDALAQVRRGIVAPYVERVRRQGGDEEWLDTWFSDEARKRIADVLSRLARKG
jgi:enoyl-CoA hydratase/carnithine racemase